MNNTTLVDGLTQICPYQSLADSVRQLKGSDFTIIKTYTLLRDMPFESDSYEILSYIDYRLRESNQLRVQLKGRFQC